MKKYLIFLLMAVAFLISTNPLKAQTVPVYVDNFSYIINDPDWISGDHYDATVLLTDAGQNYWATQTFNGGTYTTAGTYQVPLVGPYYMYYSMGYYVVVFVSKNDEPLNSGNNRTGWSDLLPLDASNKVYPSTIKVNQF